jgi:hypothetical protein
MEITHHDIQDRFRPAKGRRGKFGQLTARQLDGENIRSLARIAEIRDRRREL